MSEEIKNQEAVEAANQDELDQIVSLKKVTPLRVQS